MRTIYSCGPTVYNRSHIGHARTMIFSDIRARQIESHESVVSAVNITDIDDKIVERCYRKHLSRHVNGLIKTYGIGKVVREWMVETHPDVFEKAFGATSIDKIYDWLLTQKMREISEGELVVTYDQYIYFVRGLEQQFWEDMEKIGVRKPTHVIRVSDCITDIIAYIQKIIDNGYAYVSKGSVYFDSDKYIEDGFDFYPLRKECADIAIKAHDEKKNPKDFALWKAKKRIDISFQSPWGEGRPGWHIECSCMINKLFGDKIDIHCGGDDLIFPHHNNEYIQTVAYNKGVEGVPAEYFHTYRLTVGEEKMSQSRKNFITINDALTELSGRQLRLLLISVGPHRPMNFTSDQYGQIQGLDKKFQRSIEALGQLIGKKIEDVKIPTTYLEELDKYRVAASATMDTLETGQLITQLEAICTRIPLIGSEDHRLLRGYHRLLSTMFHTLGLDYSSPKRDIVSEQLLDTICDIRQRLRDMAKEKQIDKKSVYELSDWIRDDQLKGLGISLEDRVDKESAIFCT